MTLLTWARIKLNGISFPVGQYDFDLPVWDYTYEVTKAWYYPAGWFVNMPSEIQKIVNLTALPTPPSTYTVTFDVSDWVDPITDAIVTFDGVTNLAGDYVFSGISAGWPYNWSVVKSGYTTETGSQSISGDTLISVIIDPFIWYDVTFDIKWSWWEEVSNFRIKFGGIFWEINQTIFSVINGSYAYELWTADMSTQILDVDDYWLSINHECNWNINVSGTNVIQKCWLWVWFWLYPTSWSWYSNWEMPRTSWSSFQLISSWMWRWYDYWWQKISSCIRSTGATTFNITVTPLVTTTYWQEITFTNNIKLKLYFTCEVTKPDNHQIEFISPTSNSIRYEGFRIMLDWIWLDNWQSFTQKPNGTYNYYVYDAGKLNLLWSWILIINDSSIQVNIDNYITDGAITYTPNNIAEGVPTIVTFTAKTPDRAIIKKWDRWYTWSLSGYSTTNTWTRTISTSWICTFDTRFVWGKHYFSTVDLIWYSVPRTVTFDIRNKTYAALTNFKIKFNGVMWSLNQVVFSEYDGQYDYVLYEADGITPILDMPIEWGTTWETWSVTNFAYIPTTDPMVWWFAWSGWKISWSEQIINQWNPTPHDLLQTHYNRDYRNWYWTPTYWQYLDYRDYLIDAITNWRTSKWSPSWIVNVNGNTTKLIQLWMR